jgi:hypothetical protein
MEKNERRTVADAVARILSRADIARINTKDLSLMLVNEGVSTSFFHHHKTEILDIARLEIYRLAAKVRVTSESKLAQIRKHAFDLCREAEAAESKARELRAQAIGARDHYDTKLADTELARQTHHYYYAAARGMAIPLGTRPFPEDALSRARSRSPMAAPRAEGERKARERSRSPDPILPLRILDERK